MTANKIEFIGDKVENFNGWSRRCRVNGVEYHVSVRRGKSVRIPYKPRGQNRGWQWQGTVMRGNSYIWSGKVPGSIGVRGLLDEAHQYAKEPIFSEGETEANAHVAQPFRQIVNAICNS